MNCPCCLSTNLESIGCDWYRCLKCKCEWDDSLREDRAEEQGRSAGSRRRWKYLGERVGCHDLTGQLQMFIAAILRKKDPGDGIYSDHFKAVLFENVEAES